MHDKKELDKFTKFLALKVTQVIVQSRLGEKVSTRSKADRAGKDWVCFYLLFAMLCATICQTFHSSYVSGSGHHMFYLVHVIIVTFDTVMSYC